MTAVETPPLPPAAPRPVPPPKPGGGKPKIPSSNAELVVVHAVAAFLGTVLAAAALKQGWHVNIPIEPTWVLSLVSLLGAHQGTRLIGRAWHQEKIAAAPTLTAMETMAMHSVMTLAPALIDPKAQEFLKSQGL